MNNELLEALKEVNKEKMQKISSYIDSLGVTKLISDIEALLALQRQECAEAAWVENNNHQGCAIDSDLFEVNKESILNAKLF